MRQEKRVPPILAGGDAKLGRIAAAHGPPETQHRESVVVKVGQVCYKKQQYMVYDSYQGKRYPVEIWVLAPRDVDD